MRLRSVVMCAAASLLWASSASASLSPANIVGKWTAEPACAGSAFAYVTQGTQLLHVLRANGEVYRTPVTVSVDGNIIHVRFDEKEFTFRLPTRNTLQAVRYTDMRNGLTASIAPHVWHRCS